MRLYIVRRTCEYSLLVEANVDTEQALAMANDVPVEDWDRAWLETEIDEMSQPVVQKRVRPSVC